MGNAKIEFKPNYTYDDYKNWEGRWELIDGIPFAMTPLPSIKHQLICTNLIFNLTEALKNCNNYEAIFSVDWRVENEDDNYVFQPDVLAISKPISGAYISKPPEIIFEVLSPPNIDKDKVIKYKKYEENGVKYYCIVDADDKSCLPHFNTQNQKLSLDISVLLSEVASFL
jgi:Uma2 family endonuclease